MELRNFFKKNNNKNSAQNEQDFYQKAPRKKFLKIFAAASLALITCATTLLATAPFGTSAATAAAESETASSANLAEEIAEYKADIASGKIKYAPSAFGLDPENDPVIAVTQSGLEIKKSNAAPTPTHNGEFTNTALNGYSYITMGQYNGYAINWLVCAIPSHGAEIISPAGAAINSEIDKNYYHSSPIANTSYIYYDASLASGTVYLVSECTLGTSVGMTITKSSGNVTIYDTPYGGHSVYGVFQMQNTLNTYISNDTCKLKSYVDSGFIVQNLHPINSTYADKLTSRIAYAIGTSTATAWWDANGYTTSGTTVYKKRYSTTGTSENIQVATYSRWGCDSGTYGCLTDSLSNNNATAGLRAALIIKV